MDSKELMMNILRCGLSCADEKSPCHSIWEAQGCREVRDFHLPEPWNGDVENASALVVSINPRITPGELFPRFGCDFWLDKAGKLDPNRADDFFRNRFEGYFVTHEKGTCFKVRHEDGSMRNPGGHYWTQVHHAVQVLLNRLEIVPGRDYALTEVVHCKTLRENAAAECCNYCAGKWFEQILCLAKKAKAILVLGNLARIYVSKKVGINAPQSYRRYQVSIGGTDRICVFADHPASFGGGIDFQALGRAMTTEINPNITTGTLKIAVAKRHPRYPAL